MMKRRHFLLSAATLSITPAAWTKPSSPPVPAQTRFKQLERDMSGRLGVYALDTSSGTHLAYRAEERFPFCSTFKMMLSAAILKHSTKDTGVMERRIQYSQSDLLANSPITEKHLKAGMTVAELCAAAIQYSDNAAANLLIDLLGSPADITAFARSIGDRKFRLDRKETALNTAIPGDLRDTTTPKAMGLSLQKLVLGDALLPHQRDQLAGWLKGNTTGGTRIRAGVPQEWIVGDKTGTGDYGSANDISVLWLPDRPPVILAVYTTQESKDAKARNDIIASAASVVSQWIETLAAKNNN